MKHRVLLVSDMHYTTNLSDQEMKKVKSDVRVSAASGDAFGYTQEEKIEKIAEAVQREHSKSPLDAVLVLGDLSIDDYDWRNLPDNYCEKFRDECMKKFPCPGYAIAGNHDSYPDEIWYRIFGYHRQFSVKIGNVVFILLDTFRELPAKDASGAHYTPVDMDFLNAELAKYPNQPVVLCAHYFDRQTESKEFQNLVRNNPKVAGLFYGHAHNNRLEEFCGKPFVDIGGYAYAGMVINGKYTFSVFDFKWAWGYELIEWDDEMPTADFYHTKPAEHYVAQNGIFDTPLTLSCQGKLTLL